MIPDIGVVLEMDAWNNLSVKLREHGVAFEIEPYIRFKGEPGEQATMFFYDPSGNALEFKAFKNREAPLAGAFFCLYFLDVSEIISSANLRY